MRHYLLGLEWTNPGQPGTLLGRLGTTRKKPHLFSVSPRGYYGNHYFFRVVSGKKTPTTVLVFSSHAVIPRKMDKKGGWHAFSTWHFRGTWPGKMIAMTQRMSQDMQSCTTRQKTRSLHAETKRTQFCLYVTQCVTGPYKKEAKMKLQMHMVNTIVVTQLFETISVDHIFW